MKASAIKVSKKIQVTKYHQLCFCSICHLRYQQLCSFGVVRTIQFCTAIYSTKVSIFSMTKFRLEVLLSLLFWPAAKSADYMRINFKADPKPDDFVYDCIPSKHSVFFPPKVCGLSSSQLVQIHDTLKYKKPLPKLSFF